MTFEEYMAIDNSECIEEKSESKKWICKDCHYRQDDDGCNVCTQGDVITECDGVCECDVYTKSQSILCAELAQAFVEGLADGLKDSEPKIKDSGARREFETGAVRDIQEGKGRCDLLPLDVVALYIRQRKNDRDHAILFHIWEFTKSNDKDYLYAALDFFELDHYDGDSQTMFLEVSKHFEEGSKKYGEYNWQKGIPTHCYIDSAVRHYLKYLRGDKDEPHDRAFVWNILCCIWTCIHKPELNDYAKKRKTGG